MKILRFLHRKNRKISYGILRKEIVFPLKKDNLFKGNIIRTSRSFDINSIRLLPPCEPTKIVLVGLNYRDHAKELDMKIPKEPIIFIKPPSAIIGPFDKIIYPEKVARMDYEAELAMVIRKKCRKIKKTEAPNYILGYTCLNDVTARDLQKKDTQWTRSKSFDTFCPVGPYIETKLDTSFLEIRLFLNNKIKQCSNTKNLIFPPYMLVSFISHIMTLYPGDIIATGTPPGVGPMKKGDTVRVEIEKIGSLTNSVK